MLCDVAIYPQSTAIISPVDYSRQKYNSSNKNAANDVHAYIFRIFLLTIRAQFLIGWILDMLLTRRKPCVRNSLLALRRAAADISVSCDISRVRFKTPGVKSRNQ